MSGPVSATRKGLERRRRDGGYVTVVVLTFAGLMAALVAATLNVARPSIGQALVNVDDMQANALLEAGLAAAGFALFGDKRPAMDVDGLELPMRTGSVRLRVESEWGRVDLNGARPELLRGLYEAVGTGAMSPRGFAGLVSDWRDRNSKADRNGGEEKDYRNRGLDYRPRNGPFLAIEELMLLPGMTAADYEALAPYLTINNPIGMIDPAGAPYAVLMAVPEMTENEAGEIKALFSDPEVARRDLNAAIRRYRRYLTAGGSEVFRVTVEARLKNGFAKTAEAVLMAGFRRQPYFTLSWQVRDGDAPQT